jgi:VWFA-related protein
MTLDVAVTDKSGRPISGLQQQNFTLLDNNQPQKINTFRAVEGGTVKSDPPVELILLIDQVNATIPQVAYTRDAIEQFLKRNGGKIARPVSTVFFTDTGTVFATKPSQDGNAIIARLNQQKGGIRAIGKSQGYYGDQDRLNLSVQTLKQIADYELKMPGRKFLVWISPGWPMLSGPDVIVTSKWQLLLFSSIVGLSDELRQARITLYSIDPLGTEDAGGFQPEFYKQFVRGVKNAGQVRYGNLALQVLALQSGGRVFNSNNDLAGEIAACDADAGAFYVVTFNGHPGEGPNEYHTLAIKLDKPALTVRTRAGYYAQP